MTEIPRQLGLAIATYERPALTMAAFADVYHDDRVVHVAISDDASRDYADLAARVSGLAKVTLAQNATRLGSWANKRVAVELSQAEWVALIDSDNVIDQTFLDALDAVPAWEPDVLYLPTRGLSAPTLDYRQYEGLMLDRYTVAPYLSEPRFQMLLNTGNFFVNRKAHLRVCAGASEESFASDGIYFVYRWLTYGYRMLVTPNLVYHHLVHHGHWMQTAEPSLAFASELIRRMGA